MKIIKMRYELENGFSRERLYTTFSAMKARCDNATHPCYDLYGGRGITIFHEWYDYSVFRKWALESGYTDKLTIERIDVNKNYCPKNCCWITQREQGDNKRDTNRIIVDGEITTFSKLSKKYGVDINVIRSRVNNEGWDAKKAATTPIKIPLKIGQYSITGELINICNCIGDAIKAGFGKSGICHAIYGRSVAYRGFKWEYE